jgi:hypothetical protein
LASDIAFLKCACPVEPTDTARGSANALACTWQLAHACVPLPDRRLS